MAQQASEQPVGGTVAIAGRAFMARRNFERVRVGDRIVIQTENAGQAEALVMGGVEGEVLIRVSRWAATIAVRPECILRRLGGLRSAPAVA